MPVRIAVPSDAPGMLEIYMPYVLYSTCTFETVVPTRDQFEKRLETGLAAYPWIVFEHEGIIAGYVYASRHRERTAYQWTCECSVYVRDQFKGLGIGHELYKVLFNILRIQGLVNVYAGITLPNEASIRLHEKCGFAQFAVYENIGYKLGSWQKVGWWRLQLKDYQLNPAPPIAFSELQHDIYSELLHSSKPAINPLRD